MCEKQKKQCPHNAWVKCNDEDCEYCGWNPARGTRPNESSQERKTSGQRVKRQVNNTSGHTGVYCVKTNGKWRARINANGKTHCLGTFERIEDAIKAREEAEKKFRTKKFE